MKVFVKIDNGFTIFAKALYHRYLKRTYIRLWIPAREVSFQARRNRAGCGAVALLPPPPPPPRFLLSFGNFNELKNIVLK